LRRRRAKPWCFRAVHQPECSQAEYHTGNNASAALISCRWTESGLAAHIKDIAATPPTSPEDKRSDQR
jgi:hypothetical protein